MPSLIVWQKCINKKSVYVAVHYCFVSDRTDTASMLTRSVWLLELFLVSVHLVSGVEVFYGEAFYGANGEENDPTTIDEVIANAAKGTSEASTYDASMGPNMKTEGMDMVVTEMQHRKLHSANEGREEEHTMVATPWTDGIIPYIIIESDFDDTQLRRIRAAMRNWEDVSCVRFVPATASHPNNVTISSMKGCWAHLGMLGGAQKMSLNAWNCFWKGTIEHEFGHTLGLIHEHQRAQRDPYIKVDYFAVKPDNVEDLKKYAEGCEDKMGLEYDYHSVMHYGKEAFTDKGKPTIYTVDPRMSDVIGMTLLPSFLDAKLINLMYKCKDRCRRPRRCRDECFLTKDCTCFCPRDIDPEICVDQESDCAERALLGDCRVYYGHMHDKCRRSCGICQNNTSVPRLRCIDGDEDCGTWAQRGDCESNPRNMLRVCPISCGVCQEHRDYIEEALCIDRARDCRNFEASGGCDKNPGYGIKRCRRTCRFCMENMNDPRPQGGCRDVDSVCSYWAEIGMCIKQYTWMSVNCQRACGMCNFALPAGCEDESSNCHDKAFGDECDWYPENMLVDCKLSCNQCQGINVPFVCRDYHKSCQEFAEAGECHFTKKWMRLNCLNSCGGCPGGRPTQFICKDWDDECDYWAKSGECTNNPEWMPEHCAQSCGKCGPDGSFLDPPTPEPVDMECKDDLAALCPSWASQGQCWGSERDWMRKNCRKSCGVCVVPVTTTPPPCEDYDIHCLEKAERGDCDLNPGSMKINCRLTCGFCSIPGGECEDRLPQCVERAQRGDCYSGSGYLRQLCPKSCNLCSSDTNPVCIDLRPACAQWAQADYCTKHPKHMEIDCRRTCGLCGS